MAELPFTYAPLNTLKPLAEEVWIVDGPSISMAVVGPISSPFPTRMTVIRLGGAIWLHSPVAFETDLAARIAALGPVRWLVAPNKIHYAAMQDWHAAFPEATCFGVPGTAERAARFAIPLPPLTPLAGPVPWAGQIDQITVTSRFMSEVEFFHRDSHSLILTDLIEALSPRRVGPVWRLIYRLAGNLGPVGGAPRDFRATFRGHMPAAREAARQLVALQPERVIIAHGDCYLQDATAQLRKGLAWLLR